MTGLYACSRECGLFLKRRGGHSSWIPLEAVMTGSPHSPPVSSDCSARTLQDPSSSRVCGCGHLPISLALGGRAFRYPPRTLTLAPGKYTHRRHDKAGRKLFGKSPNEHRPWNSPLAQIFLYALVVPSSQPQNFSAFCDSLVAKGLGTSSKTPIL